MKTVNFAEVLKAGYEIRIESDGKKNKEFAPATFRYRNDGFYYDSPAMIGNDLKHPTMTPARFNRHIKSMIEEGFKVIIFTP